VTAPLAQGIDNAARSNNFHDRPPIGRVVRINEGGPAPGKPGEWGTGPGGSGYQVRISVIVIGQIARS
jgi:hypothetical protein